MTQKVAGQARTIFVRAFFYAAGATAAIVGAGCGGSSNPLDNPPSVSNPAGAQGRRLSFAYYQRCINPIFLASINNTTCAASGCHDNANGTGGAFRVVPGAATVDLANAANTPDVIRAGDMYKNFYSSQGSVVIGAPLESRLLNKPLVRGVLHGGGLILTSAQDPNAQLIEFWINRPAAQGQDEFSSDPSPGTCNTQ